MRIVFCSCPRMDARSLAKKVIRERLAACVQIIPLIESVYWWKGKIVEDEEALLLFKTDASVVSALTDFLAAHHPYTVPEILSVPVAPEEGHQGYRTWLLEQICSRVQTHDLAKPHEP